MRITYRKKELSLTQLLKVILPFIEAEILQFFLFFFYVRIGYALSFEVINYLNVVVNIFIFPSIELKQLRIFDFVKKEEIDCKRKNM